MTSNLDKIEHLKMVQGIINRMAGNSAQMKAWAVALTAGIIAFAGSASAANWRIAAFGCIPILVFWAMDASYLQLERRFRALHNAIDRDEAQPFTMNFVPYSAGVPTLLRIAVTWSVWPFYVALLIALAALWWSLTP